MFRVLSVDDGEWGKLLAELPPSHCDVHFMPGILKPYVRAYDSKAGLAVTKIGYKFVIQPFFIKDEGVRNAYNFGGPVSNEADTTLWAAHRELWDAWKREWGYNTEHTILNPFLTSPQIFMVPEANHIKDVVWMDLTKPFEMRGTTRRLVTKAAKNLVVREFGGYASEFAWALYNQTMKRRKAAPHWMFPPEFFKELGHNTESFILAVFVDSWLESACMVISGPNKVAYYHFAGTTGRNPSLGANQLLVHEAAITAKKRGHEKLCLGGGLTPSSDDSLFIFKAGFSKERAPVYVYKTNSDCV